MSRLSLSLAVGVSTAAALCMVRMRRATYSNLALRVRPPVLEKRPKMVPFGAVAGQNRGPNPMKPVLYIEDPYFYVRDDSRKNKEVLEHLRKENEYTDIKTKHLANVRANIYNELLSHVQETDEDYPYPHGPYLYYNRTVKGNSYLFHCRKSKAKEAAEELLLDENEIAKGHSHCQIVRVSPSPDHRYLAYMVDFVGYETYTGYVKDLQTGELLPDRIKDISSLCWGKDASVLYYATQDDAHRQDKLWRHKVGCKDADELLYTEDDEIYSASFQKSRSGNFMFLVSSSSETSEVSFIDLDKALEPPQVIAKRQQGLIYEVDDFAGSFYIVTNKDKATNFKLMKTSVTLLSPEHWVDVFPYDETIKIDSIDCFKDFMVMEGRHGGYSQLWIVVLEGTNKHSRHQLTFEEPIHTVFGSVNRDFDTNKYRFVYSSMTTPGTTFDYDVNTRKSKLLKEKPVPNYDRSLYQVERLEAKANDGTMVPISLVYRSDMRVQGRQPLHLYGYGSYEISIDPSFVSSILPLLDRGVIYAIAHIRGGGELGRTWYEDAKYKNKVNTFADFVCCAEHLVNTGYTSPSKMTCEGRSAGGLLMGAVLNMRPDLFTAAIAGVPFVDVMNTMSDASIPLTTGEWEEWGNPNEKAYFEYMLSYSPYENVKQQAYPNILVTSGLYDPRVAYWEPTKWVAKLRDTKSDQNEVLLKMDLSSGHFSASDRYHYLKEKAFDLAYLLDQLRAISEDDKKAPEAASKL
uniref:Prolyl endopeptidase n=1 Tax=Peronospora matthiolae TaxID=2874970 RepID=A0AAV1TZ41_9STRA